MDAREVELRQAILESPDDLSLRLVYADHLQQLGDPRGEHIALACGEPTETETAELRRRALWQHHRDAWMTADFGNVYAVSNLAQLAWSSTYRNGFVDTMRVQSMRLTDVDAALARQPVRELETNVSPADMPIVAKLSFLPRLRSLVISNRFDDIDATCAVFERARELTSLSLGIAVGAAGSEALWSALERYPYWHQLEELSLISVALTPQRIAWLAPQLTRLKRLRLTAVVNVATLPALAEHMPALEMLAINNEHDRRLTIDDDLYAETLSAPWTRDLETLDLHGGDFGQDTARAIARLATHLEKLDLSYGRNPAVVRALADTSFPELTELNLSTSHLTDEDVWPARNLPKLTKLALADNRIHAFPAAPRLSTLAINDTPIDDTGIAPITTLPLRRLNMHQTQVSMRTIDLLEATPSLHELRTFSIGSRAISTEHLRIAHMPFDKLEHLIIHGVNDTDARIHFNTGWIANVPHFERRLELTGAAVPNKRGDKYRVMIEDKKSRARTFDPAATYQLDECVHHPGYGHGIVTHVEPVRIDLGIPELGVVRVPLRPAETTPFDPEQPYEMGNIVEHPTHGVGIVVLVQPNRLFIRLATGDEVTITPNPTLIDRVRSFFK
ncbi:MAG: TIGR02996 domain-containing protein [Kofleriaceae bacterium]